MQKKSTTKSPRRAQQLKPDFYALDTRGDHNSVPPLSNHRARALVQRIVQQDDDKGAAALIELLTGIGCDPDKFQREDNASVAVQAAFSLTRVFSQTCEKFADQAVAGMIEVQEGMR